MVGGSARGKKLLVVPGDGTRPILDRVKTSLFDILRPRISGMDMLDLFAGSGSVGIEALSQGAASCTFIDLGYKAIATIKKNLAATGLADRALVLHTDAFEYLKKTKKQFDLIYVAPPQYRNLWSEAMRHLADRPELLRPSPAESDGGPSAGQVIVQIHPKEYRSLGLDNIHETRQKRYGNTLLVFFERSSDPDPGQGRLAIEHEGSACRKTLVFDPPTPWGWVIWAVRNYLRLELAWRNRLRVEKRDLQVLRDLPQGAGLILASNHADETDFKACLELSGRCNRRFLYMMNREAFDEGHGIAGWWLQRLGAFSVERGGQNEEAKRYAIEMVKRAREMLVIFPEGEIYYLNDLVQPFKSGVVDIGMQAVVEARRTRPDWTAYLVPMAIKYRYRQPIRPILERRTRLIEQHLFQSFSGGSLPRRLILIVAELLHRQEMIHRLKLDPDRLADLSERVQEVRQAVLAQMEVQYPGPTAHDQAGRWIVHGGSVPSCGTC